jgi:hypothetical protein
MTVSKECLVSATAAVVAARIGARAVDKGDEDPALVKEFFDVYREIEKVLDRIKEEDDAAANAKMNIRVI